MPFEYPISTPQGPATLRKGLLQVAAQVSASIGHEFFQSIVKNMGEALQLDGIYLGEFAGGHVERLKILAAYPTRESDTRTDYELAGSVAGQVAIGDTCVFTRGAQKKFPLDELLKETDAQACIAVPLLNSAKHAIGVLIAIYRRPLKSAATARSMLETFAPRAAAELHRNQEEAAFRESDQRYHAFISLNPDAMWRVEFENPISTTLPEDEQLEKIYELGYLAECNDSLARLLGYERANQMVGMTVRELTKHADSQLDENLRSAIRSGHHFTTIETRPRLRDGTRRHLLRSQWGIIENGFLQRIWGTLRDITELRRTEAALRISEQRLAGVLESVQLLMVILDGEGSIAFCNDYLLRLTGWEAREIAGKKWLDVMVPSEEREVVQETFAAAHDRAPGPHHLESTLVGKDGRRWLIGWEGTSLRDSNGRVTGFAGVGRDITLYHALEAELRHAQKLDGIGRSVGIIAHDFGSLLTVISGYSAILLHERAEGDRDYEALKEIKRAAEQGAELTRQLETFGRQQMLCPRFLDLNQVTEEFCRTIESLLGNDIQVRIDLHPSTGLVCADANEIREILLSLVANAREAMPRGGSVAITTSSVDLNESRDPELAGIPAGGYAVLSVADTGIGMTKQTQEQMFEPFFTTKEPGKVSGLGLSTVFSIVHRRDGHIVVQSSPGAGTTIRIFFPRLQPRFE
jgi:PAS domain S-box-containing protein